MVSILSRVTISLITVWFGVLNIACHPAVTSPDLTAASSSFESRLSELERGISQLVYPQEIPFEPMIPKTWYIECTRLPHDPDLLGCYLGVPLRNPYRVYSISVPCGLKPDRYMVFDERTESYVLASGSCSDLKATHALYLIKSPPVFPGQQKNYHLQEITGELIKANPYKSSPSSGKEGIANFHKLLDSVKEKTTFLESDTNAAMSWADFLEKNYFLPNSWCWDTQKEVLAYKDAMIGIKSEINNVKASVTELSGWDFSALQK